MTKQEQRAGIFFILLGMAILFYTFSNLKLGTLKHPGPGFFPVICGIGIISLSAVWILKNVKKTISSKNIWDKGLLKGPATAMILIIAYASLMEILGYILSTAVFLLSWQFFIEREKWLKTGLIVVIGTAAMYFLFQYLLAVPLPESILEI